MTAKIPAIKRFVLYSIISLRHYWWYYMFVTIGIMLTISAIAYFLVIAQPGEMKSFLNWAFWFFLNIGTANITASAFSIYAKPANRLHLLTIPVSNTLRLVTTICCTIIIPLLIIIPVFSLVGNIIAAVCSAFDFIDPFTFNPFIKEGENGFIYTFGNLAFYFILQSFLLMMGSFFPKAGILKTIICLLLFLVLAIAIDSVLSTFDFNKSTFVNIFNLFMSNNTSAHTLLQQLPFGIKTALYSAGAAIVPFSYYMVYLRLKEMEA